MQGSQEENKMPKLPSKLINGIADVPIFQNSPAYQRILDLIAFLSQKVSGCELPESPTNTSSNEQPELGKPETIGKRAIGVVEVLHQIESWISEVPPQEGPRRFGNIAVRAWHGLLEQRADRLLAVFNQGLTGKENPQKSVHEVAIRDKAQGEASEEQYHAQELKMYFVESFGSSQRMDYGTGHELSFLAFIGGLFFTGYLDETINGEDILYVFETYFRLCRKLILTYTLEPAGSHGVWGLDDHVHLPYILGAAQLVPDLGPRRGTERPDAKMSCAHVPAVAPKDVMDAKVVAAMKSRNLYFSAIDFVKTVKKGPFFEHSPVLYGVTAVRTWKKVHQGMIKMYRAEVLGKFPVVQHFPLGGDFYPWTSALAPSNCRS